MNNMGNIDPFVGVWKLVPEQSEFNHGTTLAGGGYTIAADVDEYVITMRWQPVEGDAGEMTFTANPDSLERPMPADHFADSVILTRIDANTLDMQMKRDDAVMGYSRLVLDSDFTRLTETNTSSNADGETVTNTYVYVKVGE